MDNLNDRIEVPTSKLRFLEKTSRKYEKIHRTLLEYMGYDDNQIVNEGGADIGTGRGITLVTRAGLKKLNKDELVDTVLMQRKMIRKLISDLEPSKREEHIRFLDDLYSNKSKEPS